MFSLKGHSPASIQREVNDLTRYIQLEVKWSGILNVYVFCIFLYFYFYRGMPFLPKHNISTTDFVVDSNGVIRSTDERFLELYLHMIGDDINAFWILYFSIPTYSAPIMLSIYLYSVYKWKYKRDNNGFITIPFGIILFFVMMIHMIAIATSLLIMGDVYRAAINGEYEKACNVLLQLSYLAFRMYHIRNLMQLDVCVDRINELTR